MVKHALMLRIYSITLLGLPSCRAIYAEVVAGGPRLVGVPVGGGGGLNVGGVKVKVPVGGVGREIEKVPVGVNVGSEMVESSKRRTHVSEE